MVQTIGHPTVDIAFLPCMSLSVLAHPWQCGCFPPFLPWSLALVIVVGVTPGHVWQPGSKEILAVPGARRTLGHHQAVNKSTRLQPSADLVEKIMAKLSNLQATLLQLVWCPYKYSLDPFSPEKAWSKARSDSVRGVVEGCNIIVAVMGGLTTVVEGHKQFDSPITATLHQAASLCGLNNWQLTKSLKALLTAAWTAEKWLECFVNSWQISGCQSKDSIYPTIGKHFLWLSASCNLSHLLWQNTGMTQCRPLSDHCTDWACTYSVKPLPWTTLMLLIIHGKSGKWHALYRWALKLFILDVLVTKTKQKNIFPMTLKYGFTCSRENHGVLFKYCQNPI